MPSIKEAAAVCLPGERIGGSKQWLQAINMVPGWSKKPVAFRGMLSIQVYSDAIKN